MLIVFLGAIFFPLANFVFEAVEKTERDDVFVVFLCHFLNIWGKTHKKFRGIPFFLNLQFGEIMAINPRSRDQLCLPMMLQQATY